jgi:hypothetical protein
MSEHTINDYFSNYRVPILSYGINFRYNPAIFDHISKQERLPNIISGLPTGITCKNLAKQNDSKITDDEVVASRRRGNLTARFFAALRTTSFSFRIFESNLWRKK